MIKRIRIKSMLSISWRLRLLVIMSALVFPVLSVAEEKPLWEMQRKFLNLRFGMFIHFSIQTYLNVEHAPPNQDLSVFNPSKLDCRQWAMAAKSAKMTYGVLTTKHHDGFSLWDSAATEYDVGNSSYRGDVVKEFVDAFRTEGLGVGLYYSIRDKQHRIKKGETSPEGIALIKTQLTELLTQYGRIDMIVFDGWGNRWHDSPTFKDVPYSEIYWHIKSLQPECLVITHQQEPTLTDIIHFEQNAGQKISMKNNLPAQSGPCLQSRWFWDLKHPHEQLKSVDLIVSRYLLPFNTIHCNLLLNCAPNRDGLMDNNVLERLKEIGEAWTPQKSSEEIPERWKKWPVPTPVPRIH